MEKFGTGNDADGTRLQGSSGNHDTAWGLDRYSWNQGYNAKYDCQIFENEEPALVARGGGGLLLYQKQINNLSATDYKWCQTQQALEGKLIVCKRNGK